MAEEDDVPTELGLMVLAPDCDFPCEKNINVCKLHPNHVSKTQIKKEGGHRKSNYHVLAAFTP